MRHKLVLLVFMPGLLTMLSVTFIIVVLGFATPAPPAQAFGTIDGLGQRTEHERITRAALACPAGTRSTGDCFEPRSIDQLAGHAGTFGAVGAPDIPLTSDQGNFRAHCDDADFLNVAGYPQTRAEATTALMECVTHLRGRFTEGITKANGLLDSNGRLIGSEVDLATDCTFAGGFSGRAKCNAIEGLGRALHGVQDFYSHSNWADQADPNEQISINNPPGLNLPGPSPILDLAGTSTATIPLALTTGFFALTTDFCSSIITGSRIKHACLNKDKELIDPISGATTDPQTDRGQVLNNAQKAVTGAIADTQRQWADFRAKLITTYGDTKGNCMILALTQDDPDCDKVDVVLIIDSSGSMGSNDPNNNRLAAGRAYLTASLDGDFVGVVDFDSGARIASSLQKLPDNKNSLISAINTIDSSGGTNIGVGVQAGCDVLIASTSANPTKGAILLTDGQGDFSNQDSCFNTRGWTIFTFGFGDSDDALLQQIASNTGGEFKRLPTSNFVCEFQAVRSKIAGGSPGPCTAFQVNPNSTTPFPVSVPSGQGQATFSSSWSGSDVVMTLTTPSGRVINRDTVSPDVVHEVEPTFEIYTITNPEAGEWQVDLFGADVPLEGEEVIFGFSTIPASNLSPIADAGPDQNTAGTSSSGAEVTLDGTGSSDPDNDPLTFSWSAPGITFDDSTSPTPRAIFPVGTVGITTITLVVNDGTLDSAPDTVAITVAITELGPRDIKQGAIDKLSMHVDESKRFEKVVKEIQKSLDPALWATIPATGSAVIDPIHLDPKYGKKVYDHERYAVKELEQLIKGDVDDKCGGVSSITLEYTGPGTITVEVFLKDALLGTFVVSTDDPRFVISATAETGGKLHSEIRLVVGDAEVAKIKTSCKKPIDMGDVHGDFTIDDLVKLPAKDSGRQVSEEARGWAQMAIDDLVTADRLLTQVVLDETVGLVAINPDRQGKVDEELKKAEDELAQGDADRDALKPDKAIQHYRKSWEHRGHAVKEAEKE